MGEVPLLGKPNRVRHHVLGFDKEKVNLKPTIGLSIHFHHQSFGPSVVKVYHRAP